MTHPQWYPDERAFAGPEHLDAAYVAGYDRKTGVDPADDVALVRELGLGENDTLIDLGSGTGAFSLAVAPYCRRVVAVDVSDQMLAVLEGEVKRRGIDNIACVHGGFLSYQHEGTPADFVHTRHALHHLPDFWKVMALRRIAAMLKPGGVLHLRDLVYAIEPDDVDTTFERWLSHASPTSERGWTREELETHVREEFSTFSWLLESMLEHAGFRIDQVHGADSGIYVAYTCIREG